MRDPIHWVLNPEHIDWSKTINFFLSNGVLPLVPVIIPGDTVRIDQGAAYFKTLIPLHNAWNLDVGDRDVSGDGVPDLVIYPCDAPLLVIAVRESKFVGSRYALGFPYVTIVLVPETTEVMEILL